MPALRIQIEGSCFAIHCDTDAKVAVKATIKEPPLSKLEQAISDACRIFVLLRLLVVVNRFCWATWLTLWCRLI